MIEIYDLNSENLEFNSSVKDLLRRHTQVRIETATSLANIRSQAKLLCKWWIKKSNSLKYKLSRKHFSLEPKLVSISMQFSDMSRQLIYYEKLHCRVALN